MAKARILLADDHTLVAEAFKRLLEPEFEVVGTVGDGRALLREAPELKPDVVLVDLNMPLLNGLDASEQLKQLMPRTKIIVLTMNEDAEIAHETLHRWASGYLLKKSACARKSACRANFRRLSSGYGTCPHSAAARGAAASGRRPHHEGSRGHFECRHAHRGLPQIPHHAGVWVGE